MAIDGDLLEQFADLIAREAGLYARSQDRNTLERKIAARMKARGIRDPLDYYRLLQRTALSDGSLTENRAGEWQLLLESLVVTESYFFRDRGQFDLLRNQIFPELISQKLQGQTGQLFSTKPPSLRIWSAGCSTGEEPYSLAILLTELIRDLHRWDIFIVGTDINQAALDKAERGIYSPWSFRSVDRAIQEQYFTPKGDGWELSPQIRKMVNFRPLNLVRDSFPNLEICNMDLILCRNVFIYFQKPTIARILRRFYSSLRSGGSLITAHAEVYGQNLDRFQARVFPQSTVYTRCEGNLAPSLPDKKVEKNDRDLRVPLPVVSIPPPPVRKPIAPRPPTDIASLERARSRFRDGAYLEAIDMALQILARRPHYFEACVLVARSYANLGEYNQATYYCTQALDIDPLSVSCYYLLARIAETKGNLDRAKALFKRIIYLEPNECLAYLELGGIYDREGDRHRARKMQTTARQLLRKLPPETIIDPQQQLIAKDLLQQVDRVLSEL